MSLPPSRFVNTTCAERNDDPDARNEAKPAPEGQTLLVFVVHGTRKFLDRVGVPTVAPDERSTTTLGNWYATVLFWKPQVALFVNETTLLPVLVPFAPAASVVDRLRAGVEEVLGAQGTARSFIDAELAEMAEHRLAKTANRSVVGIVNEFSFLSEAQRDSEDAVDLRELAAWLSRTPCGPLYQRHVSPDRELAALVALHVA